MTPVESAEIEVALFDVIRDLARANGDPEKIFLAVEDLRAVALRATIMSKGIYEAVLAEAKEAAEEFQLQLANDCI